MAEKTVTTSTFPFASVPQVFGPCAFTSNWRGSTRAGRIFVYCSFGILTLVTVLHVYDLIVAIELRERARSENRRGEGYNKKATTVATTLLAALTYMNAVYFVYKQTKTGTVMERMRELWKHLDRLRCCRDESRS